MKHCADKAGDIEDQIATLLQAEDEKRAIFHFRKGFDRKIAAFNPLSGLTATNPLEMLRKSRKLRGFFSEIGVASLVVITVLYLLIVTIFWIT